MSADNWTVCPRCVAHTNERRAMRLAEIDDMYGKVPVAEFDAAREDLAAELAIEHEESFREDYEFWGSEEGTVRASYKGACQKCGLKVSFEHQHPFWPVAS